MPDRPQVIIRIVPDGGTRTLQQIINQLEYLSRKGKLELQRSARHLDIPVPPDQIAELARSWVQETGVYDESQPDERREQELTTHIIVSFPRAQVEQMLMRRAASGQPRCLGQATGAGDTTILRPSTLTAITRTCMSWSTAANFWDVSG